MTRYYALYDGDVLIGIGTGFGGMEITKQEYEALEQMIIAKSELLHKLSIGEITTEEVPAEWRDEIQYRVDELAQMQTDEEEAKNE